MDISGNFSQRPVNTTPLPLENKNLSPISGLNLADIALVGDTDSLAETGIPSDTFFVASMPNAMMAGKADVSIDEVNFDSPGDIRGAAKKAEPERKKLEGPTQVEEAEPSYDPPLSDNLINITILHTNDIHGTSEKLPALSATLSVLKKESPDAVLVDAGDIGYSAKPTEEPFRDMVSYLNDNGYLCVVPGNHDFQFGSERAVNDLFKKLNADVLAANILDKETGKPLELTKPFVVKEINGVKVGFLGITTTKMATNEHPEIGEDLIAFGETETLQRDVRLAKQQGAEVLIAIVHKGFNDVKEIKGIAKRVPELDVIVTAHDHKVERTSIRTGEFPHRTYIVEAGSYGNFVGSVNLMVDPKTKNVMSATMKSWPTEKFVTTAPPSKESPEAPGM
jgi:2',3'-cyclic-nucleotide 2'-phosphodiesterase (5'-nucleotidase family)